MMSYAGEYPIWDAFSVPPWSGFCLKHGSKQGTNVEVRPLQSI